MSRAYVSRMNSTSAHLSIASAGEALPAGRRRFARPQFLVMRLVMFFAAALGLSAAALVVLLLLTGMTLAAEFASYGLLAVGLLGLAIFSQWRGHSWRLRDSAVILALVIAALMLCGLVSNIGLRLGLPLADPLLAKIDRLMGFDTQAAVFYTASNSFVSAILHLAYTSSGLLCVAAACWLLLRGSRTELWRWVVTMVGAMQATALVSLLFPARGAIVSFGLDTLQGHGLPFGAGNYSAPQFAHFYAGSDPLVTLSKMHGIVTFPSFHTVMALMILQGFQHTALRNPAIIWCALTIVSTVPMGGHYFADLVGGALVWLGAFLLSRKVCTNVPEAWSDGDFQTVRRF